MGGFQAVASGIGETGEQMGKGMNDALNEALKVQLQQHNIGMDQSHLQLAQATLAQQKTLAEQQHELMRQQMLSQGWTHTGTVKGSDGRYYQQFDNPRMPLGQQTSSIPYGGENGGVPPDSMEAMLDNYKRLKEQGFEDTRAQQLAFKMVNLYRTDPSGLIPEFNKVAEELNNNGVHSVPVFGFGRMNLTTPEGRATYAQAMVDSGRGNAPLLRYLMGGGPGANKDMTGWTAGEAREFRPLQDEAKRQEDMLTKMAVARLGATFDPNEQKAIQQELMNQTSGLWKAVDDKYAEISNRHHAPIAFQVPQGAPAAPPKDNVALYDSQGRVVAVSNAGRWDDPKRHPGPYVQP